MEAASRHVAAIAGELNIPDRQVSAVVALLAEGATVPFIARYRKEVTGSLDEVQITAVRDKLQLAVELDARREAILKSLDERKLLTDELKKQVAEAPTMARLEDVFAPYRPKRRTRAMAADEKGLTPLADWLVENLGNASADPEDEAKKFLSDKKDLEVPDTAAALHGARDIIAERVSDNAELRGAVRSLYEAEAVASSRVLTGKEESEEAAKFRDYFDWSAPLKSVPSHQMMAVRRGEKEGVLMLRIQIDADQGIALARRHFLENPQAASTPALEQVELAIADGCKRLLFPSMETEMRLNSKKSADEVAIGVFADNLRELLMGSPLGQKKVLAIDPGYRTGCKVVCLDAQGKLLHNDLIFVVGNKTQLADSAAKLQALVDQFQPEAIAIGNGTASRETETFVRKLKLPKSITVVVVNESGASVYSASEAAREEFPDYDITVRGSVSIGRRLMDPLAELVKIDPKSIGVGQYQHDVNQTLLRKSLDDTVVSCVNAVGVEVNTASKQLLSYVSGLNKTLAENIVSFRDANGAFTSRAQLKEVSRFGDKAFEQAAGFLRVRGGEHPLDASAVHPERYALVEKMAADLGVGLADLIGNSELCGRIKLADYVSDEVGLPTLEDIVAELAKPGRDPRAQFEAFSFTEGVEKITDLTVGMKLPGIVTNVTAFGAFVDIGVHQDGLVHISQLADKFVSDPAEVVKVQQKVQVTVMEVDVERKRIGLSMKANPEGDGGQRRERGQRRGEGGERRGGGQRRGGDRRGGGQRRGGDRRGNAPRGGVGGLTGDWFSEAVAKGKKGK
ncbi:Tex family protein [Sulfuriroseicoccus oceanibius]|uniref:RNA-binding transcriptional accessory protein n=1 Tax=Sulfuriroseicoccus oceanibius TaxID=2707525 RepID=A0A6B3L6F8_9BACT|nr:Tex family protein [Sulfuriroseicoccus oceanibius]QQL45803.1 RNA-binding transcriptional accessory protein [Sulfuriroseicoccus oceanibius]